MVLRLSRMMWVWSSSKMMVIKCQEQLHGIGAFMADAGQVCWSTSTKEEEGRRGAQSL